MHIASKKYLKVKSRRKGIVIKKCEEALGGRVETNVGFNLLKMTKEETVIILKQIKSLNKRNCGRKITNRKLNTDLMNVDDIEMD